MAPKYSSLLLGNPDMQKVPVYVKVNERDNGNTDIVYAFFYGYNGATNVLYDTIHIGAHYADLEHITVTLDINDELKSVYYSAHSGGELVPAHKVKTENGHPVVYIAEKSHASYPDKGTYVRIYGFGNDKTGDRYKWTPEKFIHMRELSDPLYDPKIHGFMRFRGSYGYDSVSDMGQRDWETELELDEIQGIYISTKVYTLITYIVHTLSIIIVAAVTYFVRGTGVYGAVLKLLASLVAQVISYNLISVNKS